MPADTKQMIAGKLFELLEHRKIDTITVKYLVDACHISRQTFYYHFRDIMDVLEWGARQTLERDLQELPKIQDPRAAIGRFIGGILQRRTALRMLLNSQRRAEYEQLLRQPFRAYLQELFRRRYPAPRLSVADADAMLTCYTYGILGLILERYEQPQPDEALLADQVCRLLSGEMLSLLE